jgi:mono/diheme cytochrome c family protein
MAGATAGRRPIPRLATVLALLLPSPAAAGPVDFDRDVLPVLSTRCFACHGPDAAKRKADLRLDTRSGALADRDGSKAVVPGRPAESALLARVGAGDTDGRMPPPKAGPRLTSEQVRVLRAWVEQGAEYSEHWAFRPLRPPGKDEQETGKSLIDALVRVRLEAERLTPAPPADRVILLRRVALDLTGLPPSPEEVAAFEKDSSPDAYEKLVDRLLASPHFGERWGRHWLDVARYADSGGFETDIFYGGAWRYRDYVIRSFNSDKPFDRFVKEQIAGDELYPGDTDARVATSLYAVGPVLQEAGMVPGKLDYDWLTDAVDTTGSAFLGLTVGCARCHDHKYDPVSQTDYYALQAVFAGSDLFDFKPDGSVLKEHVALRKTETEFDQARKKKDAKKQPGDFDAYPEIPVRGLGHRSKPLSIHLLSRGELDHPGKEVAAGLPAKLAGKSLAGVSREKWRSALAEWVADPKNPLTARVIVNRVWHWHFGEGLVHTPNDFGIRGDRPTHPELLDALAARFVARGWSLKWLHREIVLSQTYRQSSNPQSTDPDNRLLSRYQPRRVEAEVVWDAMRAAAGTLDRRMYGLPVIPPLDPRELIGNYKKWPAGPPEEANRRAVYVMVRRSFRFPALGAFDLPENVASCGRRDCTVVPTQALTLLNSRAVREQAVAFAGRLRRETDGSPEAIAARAWRLVYGRAITDDERRDAAAFLKASPIEELCVALFNTNEFLYLP